MGKGCVEGVMSWGSTGLLKGKDGESGWSTLRGRHQIGATSTQAGPSSPARTSDSLRPRHYDGHASGMRLICWKTRGPLPALCRMQSPDTSTDVAVGGGIASHRCGAKPTGETKKGSDKRFPYPTFSTLNYF